MAARKDDGKKEISLVAAQNFIKENYRKENCIQRVKWPTDWGYIVPMYKEVYGTLSQGNREPLPEKVLPVKQETYARFEQPEPECKRSLPPTTTKMYGWTVGNSVVEHVDRWIEPRPYLSMYKQLGWGFDSQH